MSSNTEFTPRHLPCDSACARAYERRNAILAGARARRSRTPGFTLIELLVVVVIIGLLAGLVAPRYFGQVGKSNVNIARAQIDSLGKALDQYRLDVGVYPTSDQGLQALITKPDGMDRWQGPYLQKQVPADPWGRAYHYKAPGDHSDYDLYSYGADGQPGGTGENVDVNNWEVAAAVSNK